MPPDEPTDEERLEQLPEDGQTPFNEASPSRDPDAEADDDRQIEARIDDTHPATDDGVELDEYYQEGLESAADASEPNAGNAVVGYTPPAQSNDDSDDADNVPDEQTDERGVS